MDDVPEKKVAPLSLFRDLLLPGVRVRIGVAAVDLCAEIVVVARDDDPDKDRLDLLIYEFDGFGADKSILLTRAEVMDESYIDLFMPRVDAAITRATGVSASV